jgi:hypothetical protein
VPYPPLTCCARRYSALQVFHLRNTEARTAGVKFAFVITDEPFSFEEDCVSKLRLLALVLGGTMLSLPLSAMSDERWDRGGKGHHARDGGKWRQHHGRWDDDRHRGRRDHGSNRHRWDRDDDHRGRHHGKHEHWKHGKGHWNHDRADRKNDKRDWKEHKTDWRDRRDAWKPDHRRDGFQRARYRR